MFMVWPSHTYGLAKPCYIVIIITILVIFIINTDTFYYKNGPFIINIVIPLWLNLTQIFLLVCAKENLILKWQTWNLSIMRQQFGYSNVKAARRNLPIDAVFGGFDVIFDVMDDKIHLANIFGLVARLPWILFIVENRWKQLPVGYFGARCFIIFPISSTTSSFVVLSCGCARPNFSNCRNARQILVLAVFDFRVKPTSKFGRYVITVHDSVRYFSNARSVFSAISHRERERINAI